MSCKRSTAVVDKFIQDNNVESNVILESQQAAVNNNRIPEKSDLKLTTIINNIASRLNEVKTSKMNETYTNGVWLLGIGSCGLMLENQQQGNLTFLETI